MRFVLFSLRRRNQIITEEVLCEQCFLGSACANPLTETELARGYVMKVDTYIGDRPCADCERVGEYPQCALCEGHANHPYHPELCRIHGDQKQASMERAFWSMRDAHHTRTAA